MPLRLVQMVALALASVAGGPPLSPSAQAPLAPTAHPALAASEEELWFVPTAADRTPRVQAGAQALGAAVRAYGAGDYEGALKAAPRTAAEPALADYATYYRGLAYLRLKQIPEAKRAFEALIERRPEGALYEAAVLAQGEAAETAGEHAVAVRIYGRLANDKARVSDEVLARLGRAALAAGDRKTAAEAYIRLYYEFPLTDAGATAASRLPTLRDLFVRRGYEADLGRAAVLYNNRRYPDARAAYEELLTLASGDDRDLAALRVAQCDFHLKRHAAARDALRRHTERGRHRAEAQYFYASALRELGQHAEFVSRTRALVEEFPDSPWAEEALNGLGTHYILTNDDEAAARAFGELYGLFPRGARAERAAWKYGWWSYKTGDYATTARVFERAAADFPRSDYRPSFLYWAARAHGRQGAAGPADARYRLVYTDYGNSYYGRLVENRVARRPGVLPADFVLPASHQPVTAAPARPATERRIRLLLAAELYDDAIAELGHAQRQSGTSPALEATLAWAYHRKGDLRRAITLMRRAYPQHLTASGQDLPVEMRQVIFPLVYWDLIRKYAGVHKLDPYLVAALIAQESTFQPHARSVANAWGLMQLLPATGRRMALAAGMKGFTPAMLTVPETNIRLGTFYFARLVQQFGGTHYALASYNAGANRVTRWKAERPGLEEDEFIDDIPFPETQNYVKRILGTAEDYRQLYGKGGGKPLLRQ